MSAIMEKVPLMWANMGGGEGGGLTTPLPQFWGVPEKSSGNRVNVLVEVTAPISGRVGYIKKSSWNRFIMILLDRNKTTKEHDINANDGLKTDFYTVGGSVHD